MDITRHRILVTGAGGFIGSHLVEALLAKGCQVRALVRYNSMGRAGWLDHVPRETLERIEIVRGDVCHGVDRLIEGCSVVFNLAARVSIPDSYQDPEAHDAVNRGGTLNLLMTARRHGVERFIQTSTSEVYGTAQYTPMDEAHPLNAQSPYAASKIAADQLASSFHRSYGLPVTVVRPFNTYGPRQSVRAVIPAILVQMLSGNRCEIGADGSSRDFTYVWDTVAGFIALAECDDAVGQTVNLGGGEVARIGLLTGIASHVLGWGGEIIFGAAARMRPEASEVWELHSKAALAKHLTGWQAAVRLKDGLAATAQWLARPDIRALYRESYRT